MPGIMFQDVVCSRSGSDHRRDARRPTLCTFERSTQSKHGYGLIADNGSDMYITGTMDARWNNGELNPAFRALAASDFEVIRLGWR